MFGLYKVINWDKCCITDIYDRTLEEAVKQKEQHVLSRKSNVEWRTQGLFPILKNDRL